MYQLIDVRREGLFFIPAIFFPFSPPIPHFMHLVLTLCQGPILDRYNSQLVTWLFSLHREKSSRKKNNGQFPAILVNFIGAEKDAGNTRAKSMRGTGMVVRQMSQNVGGEREVSGNFTHFIAAIHQIKLS